MPDPKHQQLDLETAIFAGGCFWGMEDLFKNLPGVHATKVGYIGGTHDNPGYEDVKTGKSGHAEALEVVFDPGVTSYEALLARFFQIHDPTTPDRQGNDVGSQYRSAIFALDAGQKEEARAFIRRAEASGKWPGKFATRIEEGAKFWPAEDYHQDYLEKHPMGYSCHFPRKDWVLEVGPDAPKMGEPGRA